MWVFHSSNKKYETHKNNELSIDNIFWFMPKQWYRELIFESDFYCIDKHLTNKPKDKSYFIINNDFKYVWRILKNNKDDILMCPCLIFKTKDVENLKHISNDIDKINILLETDFDLSMVFFKTKSIYKCEYGDLFLEKAEYLKEYSLYWENKQFKSKNKIIAENILDWQETVELWYDLIENNKSKWHVYAPWELKWLDSVQETIMTRLFTKQSFNYIFFFTLDRRTNIHCFHFNFRKFFKSKNIDYNWFESIICWFEQFDNSSNIAYYILDDKVCLIKSFIDWDENKKEYDKDWNILYIYQHLFVKLEHDNNNTLKASYSKINIIENNSNIYYYPHHKNYPNIDISLSNKTEEDLKNIDLQYITNISWRWTFFDLLLQSKCQNNYNMDWYSSNNPHLSNEFIIYNPFNVLLYYNIYSDINKEMCFYWYFDFHNHKFTCVKWTLTENHITQPYRASDESLKIVSTPYIHGAFDFDNTMKRINNLFILDYFEKNYWIIFNVKWKNALMINTKTHKYFVKY